MIEKINNKNDLETKIFFKTYSGLVFKIKITKAKSIYRKKISF